MTAGRTTPAGTPSTKPLAIAKPTEAAVGLRFHVKSVTGQSDDLVVDAERALIGSAAHCEVRLPVESAAPEHVEVFAHEGRVHLSVRSADAPPMLDGATCASGPWPPGAALTIGTTTLTVDVVDLGHKRRGRSPFWLFVPVPIVAVVASALFARSAPQSEPPIPDAPPLFDAPIGECPMEQRGEPLRAFAAEKLRLALAKRERGPFSPTDAVDGVPLFETAAACSRAANASEMEHDAASAGAALRAKLEDEYKVRRVRLEHAFRIGDPFGAKRELAFLLPMLAHRPGAYADWLASLDRYATLEVERRTNRGLEP